MREPKSDAELNAANPDRQMIFVDGQRMFLYAALAILIAEREQANEARMLARAAEEEG